MVTTDLLFEIPDGGHRSRGAWALRTPALLNVLSQGPQRSLLRRQVCVLGRVAWRLPEASGWPWAVVYQEGAGHVIRRLAAQLG